MYDYIVIGAGTAGCALAARLSEDAHAQVLLIEAGPPDRDAAVRTPLAYPKLFQTALDWNLWTEPQTALGNRHLYWPRGKTLGGSGSIGAMVHMPACPADLNAWSDAGNPGWSFAELQPFYQRLAPAGIPTQPLEQLNPLSTAFLDSCDAAGVPRVTVLEDAAAPGAGAFRVNIRRGRRWSVADAYLRPALRRGNLTVWTNIQVRRVLFEGSRATGVEYSQADSVQQVAVTREIILCAGAVGSPQLLLLSGLGPADHLESLGIPIIAPLTGVGGNLQDHLAAPVSYFSLEPLSYSGARTFANQWKHRLFGTGPLASNGAEVGAMFQTQRGLPACDVEIVFAPAHYVDHGFASPGGHGFSLIPALLTPKSRGAIRLASADPGIPPVIDPAYLSDPSDLAVLAEGVRLARSIVDKKPLAQYRGAPVQGQILEPEEHVRAWGQTLYHPVGTCRMGAHEGAVVDPLLRVHGVTGLRVADASIMPLIPRAHTNATTLAIAEKAAQLLRG
ncbi:MAG: GMC family oxidoreductase N-terminal domain-containing protein [Acidobacteriota bacterium]